MESLLYFHFLTNFDETMDNIESFHDSIYAQKGIAIFIDGDNIKGDYIDDIIKEASKYGQVIMKRVYGDWNKMKEWSTKVHEYSLTPCQIFPNTKNKNATDLALAVDLIDILHDGLFDGYCIISSDGDFTILAQRVKEHKKFVLGMGAQTTPKSFQSACNRFVFLDNIISNKPKKKKATDEGKNSVSEKQIFSKEDLLFMLDEAYEKVENDDGYAHLSQIVGYLQTYDPGFDYRNYGVKKAIELVRMFPKNFEIYRTKSGSGTVKIKKK